MDKIIKFPNENEFNLANPKFTLKELYLIADALRTVYNRNEIVEDKIRHLIYYYQEQEKEKIINENKQLEQEYVNKTEKELKDNNYH